MIRNIRALVSSIIEPHRTKIVLVLGGFAIATAVNAISELAGELGERATGAEKHWRDLAAECERLEVARHAGEQVLANLAHRITRARHEYADVVNGTPAAEPYLEYGAESASEPAPIHDGIALEETASDAEQVAPLDDDWHEPLLTPGV